MLDSIAKQPKYSLAALLEHLRTPLYRNGYSLLLSGIASSGLGLLYWLVAARVYDTTTVGLNSTLISAMMLLSGLGQLSLNSTLVRFIPRLGSATARWVAYTYLLSIMASGLLGLAFVWGIDFWSPSLRSVFATPVEIWGFVLSVIVWSIFSLQDSVLTGLRQASWVPLENIAVAIAKIFLVVLFATQLAALGIFAAWMIPAAIALLPINLLLFGRLLPRHMSTSAPAQIPQLRQQVSRYVAGNYIGTLFFMAYTTFLPLVVTNQAGTRATAHFYIPWMLATGLQLIAQNMTTSLTVEVIHDETKLAVHCYRALLQSLRLLLPLVALIGGGAGLLLGLFGQEYANEGALLLRLLALATIPNVVVSLYLSLVRVQNRARGVILTHGAAGLLLLGISYWLLPTQGIVGVGWASLISQSCLALLVLLTPLRSILREGRSAYHGVHA